ncbi:hypothetical protein TNCV_2394961 [Trichonephila clavipes]|nr:hypothetical protein TNCV_2394961 [Trichonephila clavipes]
MSIPFPYPYAESLNSSPILFPFFLYWWTVVYCLCGQRSMVSVQQYFLEVISSSTVNALLQSKTSADLGYRFVYV